MFAAKTTNRGKLDSHCWFFDGFAYLLQPDFCVLFDAGEEGWGQGAWMWERVKNSHIMGGLPCCRCCCCLVLATHPPTATTAGTKPMPFALRNTYAHFKRNPWCGGLTGELRVERPYRNFLTSVQYMEWKVCSRGWWVHWVCV